MNSVYVNDVCYQAPVQLLVEDNGGKFGTSVCTIDVVLGHWEIAQVKVTFTERNTILNYRTMVPQKYMSTK